MSCRRHRPWIAAVFASLAACDAATYVEGVVRWESRDASYTVEYVAPPWEIDSDDGEELRLQIAAELFGVSLEGSPPTHVFTLGPVDPARAITELLPEGLAELDTDVGDAPGTSGGSETDDAGDETGEDADAWADIDLSSPQQVALAELDQLVTHEHADLIRELGPDDTAGGAWMYEVVIAPGLFVRGYYYPAGDRTIRAMFASLFTLTDGDVSSMAATITVEAP